MCHLKDKYGEKLNLYNCGFVFDPMELLIESQEWKIINYISAPFFTWQSYSHLPKNNLNYGFSIFVTHCKVFYREIYRLKKSAQSLFNLNANSSHKLQTLKFNFLLE
jgi:hypothetical protein